MFKATRGLLTSKIYDWKQPAEPINIEGTVVLVKKNVLSDLLPASVVDYVRKPSGDGIGFQLISSTVVDADGTGVIGLESILGSDRISATPPLNTGESEYGMQFNWDPNHGIPGAFYVRNHYSSEFFLKTLTLYNVPDKGRVHFVCDSWVYPSSSYAYCRIFFSNDTYVTGEIPASLKAYVEHELERIRGDDVDRELNEADRIYGYALYNDLGYDRPVLGGNSDLPYPRRGRTGRPMYPDDPRYETRAWLAMVRQDFYVPRDERFRQLKMLDFRSDVFKALVHSLIPALESIVWKEFQSFEDVLDLYYNGLKLPLVPELDTLKEMIPFDQISQLNTTLKEIVPFDRVPGVDTLREAIPFDRVPGVDTLREAIPFDRVPGVDTLREAIPFDRVPGLNTLSEAVPFNRLPGLSNLREAIPSNQMPELQMPDLNKLKELVPDEVPMSVCIIKFPVPVVIHTDKEAWRSDDEFGREMLAGVNPILIRRIQEFPPVSTLDPCKYGNQNSTITAKHINHQLEGISCDEAVATNRLFILDHHDTLMPYLSRINSDAGKKIYASRTILFRRRDGTLTPVAIELSLPNPQGDQLGAVSKVYTPAASGVKHSIWQLAKAYVSVNDSGVHQLISHWLRTHAVVEPFVIATKRRLSVVHPIHKLLEPHFRDTMNINALARKALISSGGLIEKTMFPGKYAMEMSAVIYKSWNFVEQALPNDLIKRGIAIQDPSQPNKVKLLIEDYPYAVDGLDIWSAIEVWVTEYCALYYQTDAAVQKDTQVQSWWAEIVQVGHGDKAKEPWWPKMSSINDLIFSCTTIIWISSALHAAVNFGQYPYGGYIPNRPTISRRTIPEPGSKEYRELEDNPDKVFLQTITSQLQTIIGISVIEILSKHSSDEVYLGQRDAPEWTSNTKALEAFERFGEKLKLVENEIIARNHNPRLKNRKGPVQVPYTLLCPRVSKDVGIGIPNSISI